MFGFPNRPGGGAEVAGRAADLRQATAACGFRRVHLVGLDVTGGAVRATVHGVVHRLPQTVRVPLRLAGALVAAGVPVSVASPPQAEPASV